MSTMQLVKLCWRLSTYSRIAPPRSVLPARRLDILSALIMSIIPSASLMSILPFNTARFENSPGVAMRAPAEIKALITALLR